MRLSHDGLRSPGAPLMARGKSLARTSRDPADRPLTPRQRRLVDVLIAAAAEGKELTREEAGRLAGYGSTPDSSRVAVYEALRAPHVRRALIQAAQVANQTQVPAYLAAIRHVAGNAKSNRDRLGAARLGMEMAGLVGPGAATAPLGPAVAIQFVFRGRPEDNALWRGASEQDRAAFTFIQDDEGQQPARAPMMED